MGGKGPWMSTPILTFPHHKGEGDEIRNTVRLIQRTIVEEGRYKKDDVLFRSIVVLYTVGPILSIALFGFIMSIWFVWFIWFV